MADEKKTLTLNDPLDTETLTRLTELDKAREGMAARNLFLDEEKVKIMAALRRVQMESDEIFMKIRVDRGVDPDRNVRIDLKSGKVTLEEDR